MSRRRGFVFFILSCLLFHSCIVDEFKTGDVRMKDYWEMQVVTPVFFGNWTFAELFLGAQADTLGNNTQQTILIYDNGTYGSIPTNSIFNPVTQVKSYNFYIDGEDYLRSADLVMEVENTCPFGFDIQLRFFNKIKTDEPGAIISWPVFDAGTGTTNLTSTTTVHVKTLSEEELTVFKESDRVEFITRFESPGSGGVPDSLNAGWPVNFKLVLSGIINRNYD